MEIKREKSTCFSFVSCSFCFARKNLKDLFGENESTSKYSTMIVKCFNIQIKRVGDDLKICEMCIEQLSGALEFRHKLDYFNISKQSCEKGYEDNCSSDYANLKLKFVVKNECMIDDYDDLEALEISDCKSDKNPKSNISIDSNGDNKSKSNVSNFKSDKNIKSNPSIAFHSNKSDFKTENPDKKLKGKNNKIHHPTKSSTKISNSFIPIIEPSALICPVCKEEFSSHTLLLQHYPNHNLNFICDVCGEAHVNKTSLIKHLSKHTLQQYPCKYCEKICTNKNTLRHHILRTHKGIDLYVCRLCPKRFSSYSARNQHRTKDHGIPAKTYVCPNCGKSYSTSGSLSAHIRREHGEIKNFKCTECDKKYLMKSALDLHFVKHTGERNFKCEVCGKSFGWKKTLTEHMKIHTNTRMHKCEYCDRSFIQKCSLKGHLKTHMQLNDYS